MSIFLTGGGDQEDFALLDKKFLELLPNNSNILVVPQACDDYDEVLERIEDAFNHKKISSFSLLKDPNKITWDELSSFDAIMIEGGNTFQLIKSIRASSFFKLLSQFKNDNKIIYADSAGAILLGNSVQTAFLGDDGDEDHNKLQDYRGLDILDHWSVHAHYDLEEQEQLQDFLYEKGSPVISLPEPAGVLIQRKTITSLGSEKAYLITFSGVIKLSTNASMDISEFC